MPFYTSRSPPPPPHSSLCSFCSDLLIGTGNTAEFVQGILDKVGSDIGDVSVWTQEEFCGEELKVNRQIERVVKTFNQKRSTSGSAVDETPTPAVNTVWGSSLYELSDAPFEVSDSPTVMTQFRNKMEKNCFVLPCCPTFTSTHVSAGIPDGLGEVTDRGVPTLEELGYEGGGRGR